MTSPAPVLSPVSLPSAMPPPSDANLDALPLELKQRICSFLTPKDLKPLRLTSKIFAAAAERYLIDRFILFNCTSGITTLNEIAHHETFSKCITTLVCDTAFLVVSPGHQCYGAAFPPPSWDDYRPKTLILDDTESYGTSTKKVMQRAHENYQAAYKDWEARKTERQVRRERYEAFMHDQTSDTRHLKAAAKVREAFERCPRLRNLVLSDSHSFTTKKRRLDVLGIEVRDTRPMSNRSWYFVRALGDLSQLSSLTLISTELKALTDSRQHLTLTNLKHFRINQPSNTRFSKEELTKCALILRGAKSLETLSVALPGHDITDIVESIRSDCLRVCLLRFQEVVGSALVDFLLRHAASLQRLGLSHGLSDKGWSPVFGSIAGKLPALRRVQFETLKENSYTNISPASAQEAEHSVVFGGLIPVLQLESRVPRRSFWIKSDRGIYIDGPKENRPLPGLWQDYEDLAIEGRDGFGFV